MSITATIRHDPDQPELQFLRLEWRLDYEVEDNRDVSDDDYDALNDKVVATLEAVRYNCPMFSLDCDMDEIAIDLDDRSADLGNLAQSILRNAEAIEEMLELESLNTPPQGLLITSVIEVAEPFRGYGIALDMLKTLQRLHAGFPVMHALEAMPLGLLDDHEKRAAASEKLAAYYQSDQTLGLVCPDPTDVPRLLVSHWSGIRYARDEMDLPLQAMATRLQMAA